MSTIAAELVIVAAIVFVIALSVVVLTRTRRRPGDRVKEAPPPTPIESLEDEAGPAVREREVRAPEEAVSEVPPRPAEVAGLEPEVAVRPSLRERLAKSRRFLADGLRGVFGATVGDETWEDVEAVLIQADIGVETATKIVEDLRSAAARHSVTDGEAVRNLLAEELVSLFETDRDRRLAFADSPPSVWLVVGVNGTGKTTTIGKLAGDLNGRGRTVALAAADTFRAAADEQLEVWAQRTGAGLVKHMPGADPGAVAFDAFAHARARGYDVLVVDTAGRLHTKTPLMDELAKIRRVIEKEGHVDEVLLVIDATAGQNGLAQAREFAEAAGVTGIVLSKLDGTAKGGIALAIEQTLGIPIKLIGVGEGVGDLEPFEPKRFVEALLS